MRDGGTMPRAAAQLWAILPALTPSEIGEAVDALIARLDRIGGDTDIENGGGDDEPSGDERDTPYPEWDSRGRHKLTDGATEMRAFDATQGHEDDEDDDRDACAAGEDNATVFSHGWMGFGSTSLGDENAENGYDAEQTGVPTDPRESDVFQHNGAND